MEWQLMTAEQKDITGLVRKFLENELAPLVQECDGVSRFPMEVFKKMGEIGLWGMDIPAEYGGPGFDLQTLSLLREEFGRVDCGFAVSFGAATVGFKQVLAGGSEEQKRAMAERLLNGEISAMCITEPQSGSDVAGTKTKAVRVGDEYIINGTKTFITNGGLANVYVVVASTNPELGHKGLSCFIVERNTPGVSVGKEENKMGICGSSTYELIFTDCRIPKDALLGQKGKGFNIAMHTLDGGRIGIAAQALGIAEGALETTVNYVKERKQFGRSIAQFQNTQFVLADLATKIEAAKLLVYKAARKKDEYQSGAKVSYSVEAAMAKLYAAEVAMEVTTKCVQLHGGYGYIKEYDVERMMRDAKITEIYEGTSEVQRMVISANLLK